MDVKSKNNYFEHISDVLNPPLHCTLQIIKDRGLISLMTRPCKFGLETYNSWGGGKSPLPPPIYIRQNQLNRDMFK